jgi:autotransporter-associated beta strand protein
MTSVSNGTLSIAADTRLGTAPGSATPGHLKLDGGTLESTATFTLAANRGLALGAGHGTISPTTGTLTYNGILAGSGRLTKAGAGALTLGGANTHSGGTTLSAGTLNVNHNTAVGSGTFTVSGAATIGNTSGGARTWSNNNAQNWNADFTFAGTSDLNLGTGAVALGANRQVTVSANTLTVAGVISGNHTLTKAGNGTLTLSGANSTRTAGTTVSAGTLVVGATKALGEGTIAVNGGTLRLNSGAYNAIHMNASAAITIASGATLTADNTVNNAHNLYGTVTLNGGTLTSVNGPAGPANDGGHGSFLLHQNVTVGGTGQSTISATRLQVNSGVSFDVGATASLLVSSVIQGANGFTKAGTGTMTMSAANVYSGTTAVNAGTLIVSGSASSSPFNVGVSGTLRGAGTIGNLTISGAVDPGNATGDRATLTCGALALNDGGSLRVDMSAAAGTPGTHWDRLAAGAITANATGTFTINLHGTPTGFDAEAGYSWTIISGTSVASFDAGRFAVNTNNFLSATDGGSFEVAQVGNNLHLVYKPRTPAAPADFWISATNQTSLGLAFTRNANLDPVIIVYDTDGTFGTPSGTAPAVGAAFAGGTVVYKGGTSPQTHASLDPCLAYFYKVWSYKGTNYSVSGLTDDETTLAPDAPATVWASATNDAGFTAAWGAASGASGYRLDVSTSAGFAGGSGLETILFQGFEGSGGDTWTISSGSGNISSTTGSGNYPASQRIRTGTYSWQVNNASNVLDLSNMSIAGYSSRTVEVRISSISTTSGNGAEAADLVRVYVATNGGAFPATQEIAVGGNSNARWGFTATQTVSTAAGTATSVAAPQSGTSDNNYSILRIGIPDAATSMALRVSAINNAAEEIWCVDDIQVTGYNNNPAFVPGYSNLSVAGTSQTVTGLASGQTYYFRVRAEGAGGCASVNSSTASVTTIATPTIALANNGTQVAAADVQAGTTNHVLLKASLGVTVANATLTNVSFTTAGSYGAADITNLTVWYSANATWDGADTVLHTFSSGLGAGTRSTPALSQQINSGGTGYIFITADIAASPSYGNTIRVEALATSNVLFVAGNTSGSTTAGGNQTLIARQPTTHASGLNFTAVGMNQMTVNWTSGNGERRIVVVRQGSSVGYTPTDFIAPSGENTNFTAATDQGSGNKICYDGTGASFTLTGLNPGTLYYVKIFEYNGSGIYVDYYTGGTPLAGSASTVCSAAPTGLIASHTNYTSFTSAWTAVSGATGYFLDVSTNATFSSSAGGANTNAYHSGDALGGGTGGLWTEENVAGGSGYIIMTNAASLVATPAFNYTLGSAQTLNFRARTYGGIITARNTITVSVSTNNGSTWASLGTRVPTTASLTAMSPFDLTAYSHEQVMVKFETLGATAGVGVGLDDILVTNLLAAATGYVPGYSNRTVGATSQVVTGLVEGTLYYFRVRSEASPYCTSVNSSTQSVVTRIDYAAEPTVQAHTLTFSSIATNSLNLSWTSGNGANRIVIAKQGSAVDSHPVDGTPYAANGEFESGQQLGTGNYVVYKGSDSGPITVNGLDPATTYHFRVYEYNGSGYGINYLTNSASGNPASQATLDHAPGIGIDPAGFTPAATVGSSPSAGAFTVTNVGGASLSYTVATNASWLAVSPVSGTNRTAGLTQAHTVTYSTLGMTAGVYNATITITSTGAGNNAATNSPRTIPVTLTLNAIPNPTAATATADGKTLIDLAWTTNASYNVLIVHRTNSAPTAPTQNQAYSVGGACGGGTVIWKGAGSNLEHVVASGTSHHYAFYSYTANNHYSPGVAVSTATTAFASFEVVDTFSYTNSTALTGRGGEQGWGGTWYGDTAVFTNAAGSFGTQANYPNPSGNKLWTHPPNNSSVAIHRPLAQEYKSGRIYFSYILNYTWNGPNKYAGLALCWSNNEEKVFFGEVYNHDRQLGIAYTNSNTGSTYQLDEGVGNDYIILGYYDWGAGEAKVKAYKIGSQTVPTEEPSTWDATLAKSSNDVGWINTVRLTAGAGAADGTPGDTYFDEVRIATNWNNLLAIVPTKPDDPASATVTGDGSEMNRLSWEKNGAANDVLILHKTTAITVDPNDGTSYSLGGTLDGARVIYKGSATSVEHVVAQGTTNHYKFYSVNGANYHSAGLSRSVTNAAYPEQVVVNPFSYTNGIGLGTTTVGGQGFGANYWATGGSGAWTVRQNPGTAAEDAPKFFDSDNYPAMAGNLVRLTGLSDNQSGYAQRDLGAGYSTGVVYVAFMMSYQWDGSNKWAGLSLMDGDNERAFFGKGYGVNWHTLGIGDGTTTWWADQDLRGTAPNDGRGGTGNVYLVVGKYDFENDRLQASVWKQLDNTFPVTEPSEWQVTQSGVSFASFNRLRVHAGASGAGNNIGVAQFDEIRLAREWGQLVAVACPTWAGSNFYKNVAWTAPGTAWLGDSESVMFQSFPTSPGQSGGIQFDWAQNGTFGTYFDLPWIQTANNNQYWSNKVQMTSAGVFTSRFVAAGTGCSPVYSANNPALTVSNLNPPTGANAARDGTLTNSQINLTWSRGTSGVARDVIIVRQTADSGWTTPVNGTAYNAGDGLGSGTVVYRGHLTAFSDGGLAPSQTYYYRFYSENWSYYSVTYASASASTAAGGQNLVIDGNPADWIGSPSTVINSSASSLQEFIWTDKKGEARIDSGDYPNADITEFRVHADADWVYFLVKMTNINNVAKPYVAIGVDTRRDGGSTSMNWLGDDANTFIGDGYFAGGAHHFPEYQINVHHIDPTSRIELYAHDGSSWYAPPTGNNTNVVISTAHNAIELKVPRADLNLVGEKTARFTVASYINTGTWNNDGDGTAFMSDNTSDAVDSISIPPWGWTDNSLERSSWEEDISDSDIDFWMDVKFGASGLVNNTRPTTPVLVSPTNNAASGANPTLTWNASSDGDGQVTGYLLEVSTNENFNGTSGTENGAILLRVNLPAGTTSYPLSTTASQYWWRVRARDTAGELSAATTRVYRVGSGQKTDVEGPQPTLLYIGTNVTGFLAGDYNAPHRQVRLHPGCLGQRNPRYQQRVRLRDPLGGSQRGVCHQHGPRHGRAADGGGRIRLQYRQHRRPRIAQLGHPGVHGRRADEGLGQGPGVPCVEHLRHGQQRHGDHQLRAWGLLDDELQPGHRVFPDGQRRGQLHGIRELGGLRVLEQLRQLGRGPAVLQRLVRGRAQHRPQHHHQLPDPDQREGRRPDSAGGRHRRRLYIQPRVPPVQRVEQLHLHRFRTGRDLHDL